jgi:UMF1 family MFS transporter
MYDLANSAFVTSVITVFYPIYFASTADQSLPSGEVTARFATATTIALAVTALLSPFLGLLADHYAVRKKMLAVCLSLALVSTLGLALAPAGNWQLGLLLFGLANIGASGSFVFYDSLLPHIAGPDEIDRVSSAGYAAGYLGGGTLLAINVAMVLKPEAFGLGDALNAMRWSFASVVVWWAVFSIPLFLRVSEPAAATHPEQVGPGVWGGLKSTLADLKRFDQALLLLVAFLIYNDGIGTIIRMTGIYGTEVGIDQGTLITAILVVQFLGIPCTYLFAMLASRIGSKPTIGITLLIYTGVTWVAYTMKTATQFWMLALMVASAQGACQALSRSLFASMIPERKSSQFFAFFAVAEKFAGVFGAGIFAILVNATGESRLAVLSLVLFFIIGGVLLSRLDVEKGRAQAFEANREDGEARSCESDVASGSGSES